MICIPIYPQFRAKSVFDPSGIAVLGAKPLSIGKTDARMFWNLAPPRMDVRPDIVKRVNADCLSILYLLLSFNNNKM